MRPKEPNAAPARRTRLELLVRREGDEQSFQLREVPSALAYVQSRPRRVAADGWELAQVDSRVADQKSFILKNKATDRFLVLSEPERFLWDQMDGRTSLQEMATAYVLQYGEFDFDIIPNLIRKLQRAQLLTMMSTSRLRRVLARNRARRMVKAVERSLLVLERITIGSRHGDPYFRALYRFGGFLLFTRAAVALCVLLAVAGIAAGVALTLRADSVAAGLGHRALVALVCVKLVFLVTLAAHQIVHGLALVHYGRRVREFGFTFLHGFVPTFYVDVTDIFMGSRRARVVTAVSGAVFHLVLGSVWLLIALQATPSSFLQAFAAASGIIQWQAFVVALYPFCFIEMDGYHVLVDVLGLPTLKQDAIQYVGTVLRGAAARRFTRQEALYVGYVAVSAVSVAAFIAFNVWMIVHAS
jgi:putative peptide zinc metalloprotease protein